MYGSTQEKTIILPTYDLQRGNKITSQSHENITLFPNQQQQ